MTPVGVCNNSWHVSIWLLFMGIKDVQSNFDYDRSNLGVLTIQLQRYREPFGLGLMKWAVELGTTMWLISISLQVAQKWNNRVYRQKLWIYRQRLQHKSKVYTAYWKFVLHNTLSIKCKHMNCIPTWQFWEPLKRQWCIERGSGNYILSSIISAEYNVL